MGDTTKIAWTDATLNPWIGCTHVSPGCEHCYAEVSYFVQMQRHSKTAPRELWGASSERHIAGQATWRKPISWNFNAWKRKERMRVFCASLADVFEDRRDLDRPRARLFDTIRRTPNLDWQVLTKRMNASHISFILGRAWDALLAGREPIPGVADPIATMDWLDRWGRRKEPPLNVWLGTTVEDKRRADERVPELLRTPAALRFLSMEPLLEGVSIRAALGEHGWARTSEMRADWIIVGGESGPDARAFDLAWAKEIIWECGVAKCPVFMKQAGDNAVFVERDDGGLPIHIEARKGGEPLEWPEDLRVRQLPTSPMGAHLVATTGLAVVAP